MQNLKVPLCTECISAPLCASQNPSLSGSQPKNPAGGKRQMWVKQWGNAFRMFDKSSKALVHYIIQSLCLSNLKTQCVACRCRVGNSPLSRTKHIPSLGLLDLPGGGEGGGRLVQGSYRSSFHGKRSSVCARTRTRTHTTHFKVFRTLSSLFAGWAPGDSFRFRKRPRRFFMSLALEAQGRRDWNLHSCCPLPPSTSSPCLVPQA